MLICNVSADSGTETSSYCTQYELVSAPNNAAIWISSIFRDKAKAELIYISIFAAMFSMMFHRLLWTNFFYYIVAIRLYHEFLSQFICHFDTAFFEICWF